MDNLNKNLDWILFGLAVIVSCVVVIWQARLNSETLKVQSRILGTVTHPQRSEWAGFRSALLSHFDEVEGVGARKWEKERDRLGKIMGEAAQEIEAVLAREGEACVLTDEFLASWSLKLKIEPDSGAGYVLGSVRQNSNVELFLIVPAGHIDEETRAFIDPLNTGADPCRLVEIGEILKELVDKLDLVQAYYVPVWGGGILAAPDVDEYADLFSGRTSLRFTHEYGEAADLHRVMSSAPPLDGARLYFTGHYPDIAGRGFVRTVGRGVGRGRDTQPPVGVLYVDIKPQIDVLDAFSGSDDYFAGQGGPGFEVFEWHADCGGMGREGWLPNRLKESGLEQLDTHDECKELWTGIKRFDYQDGTGGYLYTVPLGEEKVAVFLHEESSFFTALMGLRPVINGILLALAAAWLALYFRRKASRLTGERNRVLEAMPAGVAITNVNGRIRFANPGLQRIANQEQKRNIKGYDLLSILLNKDEQRSVRSSLKVLLARPVDDRPEPLLESTITIRSGGKGKKEIRAALSVSVSTDDHGNESLVWVVISSTHYEDIITADFLLRTLHHLKTPLHTVTMLADALRETDLPLDEREELSDTLHGEVKSFQTSLETMLEFRKDQADDETKTERLELAGLIDEQLEEHRLPAEEKELSMKAYVTDGLEVFSQRTKVELVLGNLLTNAIKYSDSGSIIVYGIELEAGAVRIRVKDQGCGIAPEELQTVFNRFWRSEREEVAEQEGYGLGLYIAKRVARSLGGDLEVKSPGEDRGSTFDFILPRGEAGVQTVSEEEA